MRLRGVWEGGGVQGASDLFTYHTPYSGFLPLASVAPSCILLQNITKCCEKKILNFLHFLSLWKSCSTPTHPSSPAPTACSIQLLVVWVTQAYQHTHSKFELHLFVRPKLELWLMILSSVHLLRCYCKLSVIRHRVS